MGIFNVILLAARCSGWSALSGPQLQQPSANGMRGGLGEARAGGARGGKLFTL